jgi:hypothetical protein
MKLHKWNDVARARVGGERLSRLRAQAHAEVAIDMTLRELRQALGKRQLDVAGAAEMERSG